MSLYRLYRGDLAILMADGHEITVTPLEFFEQGSGAFSKCRTSSYSPASYGQMCALPKLHAREYRGHGHGGVDPVPKCSR